MKQSEYEKLCDEAFGKPEKPNLLKVLKRHKKLAMYIAAVACCVVIAVVVLVIPRGDPSVMIEKPVALRVEMVQEDTVLGTDLNGKRWLVRGDVERVVVGAWAWFVCDPEAIQDTSAGQVTDFAVENATIWCWRNSDKAVTSVFDFCDFDIDRDGEIERCFLLAGPTSGLRTYKLSVWNGNVLECELVYRSSDQSIAFYSSNGSLKILGIVKHSDNTLREHSYDITYKNGELTISEDGKILETLPRTVPA